MSSSTRSSKGLPNNHGHGRLRDTQPGIHLDLRGLSSNVLPEPLRRSPERLEHLGRPSFVNRSFYNKLSRRSFRGGPDSQRGPPPPSSQPGNSPPHSTPAVSLERSLDQPKLLDVGQTISLLEELKKTASPEELIALHKALLPGRRVQPISGSSDQITVPPTSLLRSRADLPPGLATRGCISNENPLRKPGEPTTAQRRASQPGSQSGIEPNRADAFELNNIVPRARSASAASYTHPGIFKHGTLRVTNGGPSPEPSTAQSSPTRSQKSSDAPGRVQLRLSESRTKSQIVSKILSEPVNVTKSYGTRSDLGQFQHKPPAGLRAKTPVDILSLAKPLPVPPPSNMHNDQFVRVHPPRTNRVQRPAPALMSNLTLEYTCDIGNPFDDEEGPHLPPKASHESVPVTTQHRQPQSKNSKPSFSNEKIVIEGPARPRTQRSYDSGYGSDETDPSRTNSTVDSAPESVIPQESNSPQSESGEHHDTASTADSASVYTSDEAVKSPLMIQPEAASKELCIGAEIPTRNPPSGDSTSPKISSPKGWTTAIAAKLASPVSGANIAPLSPRTKTSSRRLQKPIPAELVTQRRYSHLKTTRIVSPVPRKPSASSSLTPTSLFDNLLVDHALSALAGTRDDNRSGTRDIPTAATQTTRPEPSRAPASYDAVTQASTSKPRLPGLRSRSKSYAVSLRGALSRDATPEKHKEETRKSTSGTTTTVAPKRSGEAPSQAHHLHDDSEFFLTPKSHCGMSEETASTFARQKSRDIYGMSMPMSSGSAPTTMRRYQDTAPLSASSTTVEDRFPGWHSKSDSPTTPLYQNEPSIVPWFADSIPPMPELPDVSTLRPRRTGERSSRKLRSTQVSPTSDGSMLQESEARTRQEVGTQKQPLQKSRMSTGTLDDRSSRYYAGNTDTRKFACSPLSGGSSPRPSPSPRSTSSEGKLWGTSKTSAPDTFNDESKDSELSRSAYFQARGPFYTANPRHVSPLGIEVAAYADVELPVSGMDLRFETSCGAENTREERPILTHSSASSSQSCIEDSRLANYDNAAIGAPQVFNDIPAPLRISHSSPARRLPQPPSPDREKYATRERIDDERAHALAKLMNAKPERKHRHCDTRPVTPSTITTGSVISNSHKSYHPNSRSPSRPSNRSPSRTRDHHRASIPAAEVLYDRYSGGLAYGWDRFDGFEGSAGMRDLHRRSPSPIKNKRSVEEQQQQQRDSRAYGLDLGDVPIELRGRAC